MPKVAGNMRLARNEEKLGRGEPQEPFSSWLGHSFWAWKSLADLKVDPRCPGGEGICFFGLEAMALFGVFSVSWWKSRLSPPGFMSSWVCTEPCTGTGLLGTC